MKNTILVFLARAVEICITFILTFFGCLMAGKITEKYNTWWRRKINDSNTKITKD